MGLFSKKEAPIDPVKGKKVGTLHPTYLGGVPDFKGRDGKLEVYEKQLIFTDSFHKDRTFTIEAAELTSYYVEGKEEIEHRLTATRMVALGIFSLAAKKKEVTREQYLTLVLNDGRNIIFSHSNRFIDEATFKGQVSTAFAQLKGAFQSMKSTPKSVDASEQIAKYAELLSKGHITQAEYDAKKKQLLEL